MKNTIIYLCLLLFAISSCKEKILSQNEVYTNYDHEITYQSETGKPFTGSTIRNDGPYEHSKTIKSTYKEGKHIETLWIDSQKRIRARFRYGDGYQLIGEIFYDSNGNAISESEFKRQTRQ